MSAHSIPRLKPDEYLALERTAEIKSEFLDGQMIAMTGGSIRHGRIASNLVQAIGLQLRGRSCEVFGSDVRVLVAQTGLYTYPDVTIVLWRTHADRRAPRHLDESDRVDRGALAEHRCL
ncbi:MAG TPA: Uma2 family endonuclease [Thermoanaerobaculia bacterium]|jgi:Uma2 family endonuclease|nr:Uma2 family endonuclease [Thermoanaerobaculia bacterium]